MSFGNQLDREFVSSSKASKEYLLLIMELTVSLLTLPPEFGCKGAVLGLHHMVKKKLHFKECMIQGFRETMWADTFAYQRCLVIALDQKTQTPPRKKIEFLPRHLPRQAKKTKKGMHFNQHIFLSIPGLKEYLNKAEKTSRARS
ncbi:hypothetical protein V6N12_048125 [Hibiscus sabdariffa]|uniref:Uncharacterized protein n=1 Tax=Hibiscus sabdariffa TaxID=183260 RepID=A0ABR2B5V4_9ROSI